MSQPQDRSKIESEPFVDCISNSKQIFGLIDRTLPLEICLHHQVLPLELAGEILTIGMVNAKDRNAIDFLRPIVTSLGYYFSIKQIDAHTHQLVLSAYLKRPTDESKNDRDRTIVDEAFDLPNPKRSTPDLNKNRTIIDETFNPSNFQKASNPSDRDRTIIDETFNPGNFQKASNPSDRDRTIIDETFNPGNFQKASNPSDRDRTIIDETFNPSNFQKASNPSDRDRTIIDETFNPSNFQKASNPSDRDRTIIDEDFALPTSNKNQPYPSTTLTGQTASTNNNNLHQKETLILEDSITEQTAKVEREYSEFINITSEFEEPIFEDNSHVNATLDVKAEPIIESKNMLASLSPKELWQELLKIILKGEVETFILKINPDYGSIIKQSNNQQQLIFDQVNLNTFNQLLNEIKVLAKLAPTPLEQSKKVAIEKSYNGERVLLRLEFILNRWGEEVIVQILRGELLESYEHKQTDKMLEQAFTLARKLEKTLKKMLICSNHIDIKDLNSLQSIQQEIDLQLKLLSKNNIDFGDS
jgi:hypothetical protein